MQKMYVPLSRILMLFLLPLSCTLETRAQSLNWAKVLTGTARVDNAYAMTTDAAGNVYLTGSFSDSVDFDPGPATAYLVATNPSTRQDIYIAKYDVKGNYLWARKMVGTLSFSNGNGRAIRLDATGNIYITGEFQGTVDFDPGSAVANLISAGGTDIFIAKYDANGNYLWAKGMGGSSTDQCVALGIDNTGNIYITGTFYSTADFDPSPAVANLTLPSAYDPAGFIAKYNANGGYLWARKIEGTGSIYNTISVSSLAVNASGNVFICGTFFGTVDFDPGSGITNLSTVNANNYDLFMARYDANGNYVWVKNIGGSIPGNSITPTAIRLDATDNILLAGSFTETVDFDPGSGVTNLTASGSFQDIFLAKYDANGNYTWAKKMGGARREDIFGTDLDLNGNVYITGGFMGTADFDPGTGTANLINPDLTLSDIFIAKYTKLGDYVWAHRFGKAGKGELSQAIKVDASGDIHVAGVFSDTVDFDFGSGTVNLVSKGSDIFLMKVYGCITTAQLSLTACDSFVFKGKVLKASGTYVDTFVNAAQCDSLVTLQLTINKSSVNPVIKGHYCDSVIFNDITYTRSGTYTQHYTNATGCDSNLIYELTLGQSNGSELMRFACEPVLFNDSLYTSTGILHIPFVNESGCDSIVTFGLIINSIKGEISKSGATLTATEAQSYLWLNCSKNAVVAGALAQVFTPIENGSYSVVVYGNNCVDTSDCMVVDDLTGIAPLVQDLHGMRIYPNPADGDITLVADYPLQQAVINLYSLAGQLLFQQVNQSGQKFSLNVAGLTSGIYMMEIKEKDRTTRFKVVKK